jgi:hypothetical protein
LSIKALEHSEHAEHAHHADQGDHGSHGGSQAALAVAIMAAVLALCEQQAKHAEIRVEENSIGAADTWAQYQGKSTRTTLARDLADVVSAIPKGATPEDQARVTAVMTRLRTDADHYEHGDDGKEATSKRARHLEEVRDHAIEQTHTFDNAAASLELGIVLATASAVTSTRKLLFLAIAVGIAGAIMGVLGVVAPEIAAI